MILSVYVPDPLYALLTRLAVARDRSPAQLMVDLLLHVVATDSGSPCHVVLERLQVDGPLDADALRTRTNLSTDEVLLALRVLTSKHGKRQAYVVERPDEGRPGHRVFHAIEAP